MVCGLLWEWLSWLWRINIINHKQTIYLINSYGAKMFSKVDQKNDYRNTQVRKPDIEKTEFWSRLRIYKYVVIILGSQML